MDTNYKASLSIPRHDASLRAAQSFVGEICNTFKIDPRIRGEVELSLEEGLTNFFRHALSSQQDAQVRLNIEIQQDLIRLTARAPGRPFDFSKLPQYRLPESVDDDPQGLGLFLIEKCMDSVQWRYLEKEGQEFEMVKYLPAPVQTTERESAWELRQAKRSVHGNITCKRLSTHAEALALASTAWDLYGYGYKDVIYFPEQVVQKNQQNQLLSWIALDDSGAVLGHYAMMRHGADGMQGEMGAAFVHPDLRMSGVFRQLSDRVHADARGSGVRGLYSLSVTNHVATQKASELMGRLSVAIHLASSPAIFVDNARPGDRITTVFNYQQLIPRPSRRVYLPERHQTIISQSYLWLGLNVEVGDPEHSEQSDTEAVLTCDRDLAWNRAVIEATGSPLVSVKLEVVTETLVREGVASIILLVDLQEPAAPAIVDSAHRLGYFYCGLAPETGRTGHDMLKLQLLNGVTLRTQDIQLYQASAKVIMNYIREQAPAWLWVD